MSSNKDFMKEIVLLCDKLGYTQIDTKNMGNDDLAATVSDLKHQLKDKENETPADGAKEEKEAKDKAAAAAVAAQGEQTPEKTEDKSEKKSEDKSKDKPPTDGDVSNSIEDGKPTVKEPEFVAPDCEFYVAKGKTLTTRRGIKSEGDEITEKDLVGGNKTIKDLVKKGYIGEN